MSIYLYKNRENNTIVIKTLQSPQDAADEENATIDTSRNPDVKPKNYRL